MATQPTAHADLLSGYINDPEIQADYDHRDRDAIAHVKGIVDEGLRRGAMVPKADGWKLIVTRPIPGCDGDAVFRITTLDREDQPWGHSPIDADTWNRYLGGDDQAGHFTRLGELHEAARAKIRPDLSGHGIEALVLGMPASFVYQSSLDLSREPAAGFTHSNGRGIVAYPKPVKSSVLADRDMTPLGVVLHDKKFSRSVSDQVFESLAIGSRKPEPLELPGNITDETLMQFFLRMDRLHFDEEQGWAIPAGTCTFLNSAPAEELHRAGYEVEIRGWDEDHATEAFNEDTGGGHDWLVVRKDGREAVIDLWRAAYLDCNQVIHTDPVVIEQYYGRRERWSLTQSQEQLTDFAKRSESVDQLMQAWANFEEGQQEIRRPRIAV